MNMPDLTPLFVLAAIGLVCSALLVLGGAGWLVWFAIEHVRIV